MSSTRLRIGITEELVSRSEAALRAAAPAAELITLRADGSWSGDSEQLDGFFLSEDMYYLPEALRSLITVLEESPPSWLQTASTGVDHAFYADLIASGATLTNAPGVHGGPIAEYVFAHILSRAKVVPEHRANQAAHRWQPLESVELAGQTMGIVGYGAIGAAIAKRAVAFEMKTVGTKRRAPNDPNLTTHLGPDQLFELLAVSDYVVLCCPLTDATLNLINTTTLSAMRSDALLINVARGRVIDHDALVEALRKGEIGGAVLDVAPYEPLAEDSPLWDLPNCIITPHDSCHVDASYQRTTDFFLENLTRLHNGEPLKWVVEDTELSSPTEGDI